MIKKLIKLLKKMMLGSLGIILIIVITGAVFVNTSLQFGGVSEITIPNSDSIGSCYLHLKLPALDANHTLGDMWGYSAIKNVSYTIGGSNISIIDLPSESIFQKTMISCETKEKRKKMAELAGTAAGDADTGTIPEAVVQIPLPWSTIRSCEKKLGYDASLLSSNILIQITFNDATAFYGSIDATSAVFPTSFVQGDFLIRQDVLTNKRDSMKLTLMKNPNLLINYPFTHCTRGSTRNLSTGAGDTTSYTIDLNSFLESDLLGISFHCVLAANEKSTAKGVNSYSNKWHTLRLRDIVLRYNGQILHNLPFHLSDLILLGMDVGSDDFNVSTLITAGATKAEAGHIYYLPMTKFKSVIFEGDYCNTSRYANQTFQLDFNLEAAQGVDKGINFYSTYYYNGVISTSNGMSMVTFA